MSHFAVAVLTDDPNKIDDLLAKFNEQPEDDSPYLIFKDCTEEVEEDWKKLINGANEKEIAAQVAVGSMEYKTIDEYADIYHGYVKQDGKFGRICNPDARWDWYVTGGRWTGLLLLKPGSPEGIKGRPGTMGEPCTDPMRADIALLKDIDFKGMAQDSINEAGETWDQYKAGEFKGKPVDFLYDIQPNDTRESFVERKGGNPKEKLEECPTFAFLNLKGEWISPGDMGFFGVSSDDEETRKDFNLEWRDCLSKVDYAKTFIVIIDCHI